MVSNENDVTPEGGLGLRDIYKTKLSRVNIRWELPVKCFRRTANLKYMKSS